VIFAVQTLRSWCDARRPVPASKAGDLDRDSIGTIFIASYRP